VEIDGQGHLQTVEHDQRRDRWLAVRGVRTLRIRAIEIRDNLGGVLAMIQDTARGER
jgi:very-short-patch-repair endonuclease